MNESSFKDFLKPFNSINHYIQALQIISTVYSPSEKNFTDTANIVNKVIECSLSIKHLTHFVERVINFPVNYGLDFMRNSEKFRTDLRSFNLLNNKPTRVLIPTATKCYFCKDIDLVYKATRFEKSPLIYATSRIGVYKAYLH